MIDQHDTEMVAITVTSVRPVQTKSLYAFCDVEIVINGVALAVHGIQVRHGRQAGRGCDITGTSICLPTFKDETGTYKPSVSLPPEIRERIADLLLEYLLDLGVSRRRFG